MTMEPLYNSGVVAATAQSTASNTYRLLVPASMVVDKAFNTVQVLFFPYLYVYAVRCYVGLQATGGDAWDIDPLTMTQMTLGGSTTITVPGGGGLVATDAIQLDGWESDGSRAMIVSVYRVSGNLAFFNPKPTGLSNYTKSGDFNLPADGTGFNTLNNSYLVAVSAIMGDYTRPPTTPVWAEMDQPYRIYAETLRSPTAQSWGLRLGRDLVEPWANAPVRVAGLAQPWRDAGELARALVQPWQDAAPLAAGLAQEWDILAPLAAGLVQPWAIAADAALVGSLAQGWDLRDVVPLSTDLAQPWTIGTDSALLRYTVAVTVGGVAIGVSSVNIEADRAQDVLSCELHPETEGDWLRCAFGAAVVVTLTSDAGSETFRFVVTAPRVSEQHGEPRWVVEAMSPAALLGDPWGVPVSGELSGLASAIAADLVAGSGVALTWATVDWAIPAACWIAADERPLALLKTLAAAVGAVVQSQPDGSLRIEPDYPVSLPAWASTAPGLHLTETLDVFTVSSDPDYRPGYNRYLVGDQATAAAAEGLRLEEETVSATVKLCRGYQVPWIGAFTLAHTGGSWVQIEALGVETRQETETVEFVAGSGRTQYPIYSRDAIEWLQTVLGSVTIAEDGTLSAAIAGQSLLRITYTTRCRKWRVRDARNEQLQLVAEL